MRTLGNLEYGDANTIKKALATIADKTTEFEAYRKAFTDLGYELGRVIRAEYRDIPASRIMMACSSEDADWLATGLEQGLDKGTLKKSIYWTSREIVCQNPDGYKIEIAPIEKAYEETIDDCRLLIVVKSIISTSCVVKTQLTRLMDTLTPEHIVIAAPVMYKDGEPNLRKEFPEEISNKFRFVYFAIDDERIGNEVVPGVGGSVYPRLGLGDENVKNSYIPQLVFDIL